MSDLKPGDGVLLKHSYPVEMTVKEVKGDEVTCVWHDEKRKEHEAVYPCAALKKVDECLDFLSDEMLMGMVR